MGRTNPTSLLPRISRELAAIEAGLNRIKLLEPKEASDLTRVPMEKLRATFKPVLLDQWTRKRAGKEVTCQRLAYPLSELLAFVNGRQLQ